MKQQAETGGAKRVDVDTASQLPRAQSGHRSSPGGEPDRLDVIACEGCGRCFATEDGPGMIAAIEGPCPGCGGRFRLAGR